MIRNSGLHGKIENMGWGEVWKECRDIIGEGNDRLQEKEEGESDTQAMPQLDPVRWELNECRFSWISVHECLVQDDLGTSLGRRICSILLYITWIFLINTQNRKWNVNKKSYRSRMHWRLSTQSKNAILIYRPALKTQNLNFRAKIQIKFVYHLQVL